MTQCRATGDPEGMVLDWLWIGLAIAIGFGLGRGSSARPRVEISARNPAERKRLEGLRRKLRRGRSSKDPTPRIELARHLFQAHRPRDAAQELGGTLRQHPDLPEAQELGRDLLAALLHHESPRALGENAGLPHPQDIDWHPGSKRMVLRLKDLRLMGLIELCHLDFSLEDFDPGASIQPMPRILACHARVREDRLGFVLDSRIDWSRTPIRDLKIEFRHGSATLSASYRLGPVPIQFHLEAALRVLGPTKLELSFPEAPRVAGFVPLPVDTVLKVLVRQVEERLPGAIHSEEEATLSLDLAELGLPPVDFNLSRIRCEDGSLELFCVAAGVEPETIEALRLPEAPPKSSDGAEAEAESQGPGGAGAAAGLLAGIFGKKKSTLPVPVEDLDQAPVEGGEKLFDRVLGHLEDLAEEMDAEGLSDWIPLLEAAVGWVRKAEDRPRQARLAKSLEVLLGRFPSQPKLHRWLGRLAQAFGQDSLVEERFLASLRLDPFQASLYQDLARAAERRGEVPRQGRLKVAHRILATHSLGHSLGPSGLPARPRTLAPADLGLRLRAPEEEEPTARLLRACAGGLRWLTPTGEGPRAGETRDRLDRQRPHLGETLQEISDFLQIEAPPVLAREVPEGPLFRWRGSEDPWLEVDRDRLDGLAAGAWKFSLAHALYLRATERVGFSQWENQEKELAWGLFSALGLEAARKDSRPQSLSRGLLERPVRDLSDTVALGWVVRSGDLDPFLAPEIRALAHEAALSFRHARPSFRSLDRALLSFRLSADRFALLFTGDLDGAIHSVLADGLEGSEKARDEGFAWLARPRRRQLELSQRIAALFRFVAQGELDDLERTCFS